MGYVMWQQETVFRIPADKKKAALTALKKWAKEVGNVSWTDSDRIIQARTLELALFELAWEAEVDEDYNIVRVVFQAEKLGDEPQFFGVLGPFVDPGSFIEMRGEDGERWRWTFDGSTMRESKARVSWE